MFDAAALALGALLMAGALLAGLARRSFLSLTAAFVLAGFLLGDGATGALEFDAQSGFVHDLAVVALIVILFRDGLEVEAEMLREQWRLPLRKLVLAMPVTCAIVALVTHALTDLDWTESFLLGALLSPTDPVLSSSVVTNPRVPRVVRHSLNLESGLNDGLALPAVLAFSAALRIGEGEFVWWEFVLRDVTLGFAVGLAAGWLASRPRPPATSLYGLGVAFATYGAAVAVEGNGFIAVFVGAITLGVLRDEVRTTFESQGEDIVELVKLGVFVVFGAVLTLDELFADGWEAVGIVAATFLLARPVAVGLALIGTRQPPDVQAFMAWFGPKGVATMTFALLVLGDRIEEGERIFNLAALAVFVSILVHGLTDTPGANWIAARRGSDPLHRA